MKIGIKNLKKKLNNKCFLCDSILENNNSQLFCLKYSEDDYNKIHMMYDSEDDGFFGPNRIEIIYNNIIAVIFTDKNVIGFYKFIVKPPNINLIKNFQYKDINKWLLKEDEFISKVNKHIGNLLILL